MNRRRFAQAIAAAVFGIREPAFAEPAVPPGAKPAAAAEGDSLSKWDRASKSLEEDTGGYFVLDDFVLDVTRIISKKSGRVITITDEMIADMIAKQPPLYNTTGLKGWE